MTVQNVPKPKRVWALQLLAGLQLVVLVGGVADAFISGLPDLPALSLVLGFAKPVMGLALLAPLLLSLQRLLPRPERVAPILAVAWCALTVGSFVFSLPKPEPQALRALTFDDVPPAVGGVSKIVVRSLGLGALLWAVGSLFVHRRTRAYLAGRQQGDVETA